MIPTLGAWRLHVAAFALLPRRSCCHAARLTNHSATFTPGSPCPVTHLQSSSRDVPILLTHERCAARHDGNRAPHARRAVSSATYLRPHALCSANHPRHFRTHGRSRFLATREELP